ncbi:hypothetical protein VFPYRLAN_101 [Candidatus Vidania fulgoroideae]|nr:hypothetical protein VFPYRLAN_101 [Candidatus Vidania fulgoroideae]
MSKGTSFFLKNKCNLIGTSDFYKVKKDLILSNKNGIVLLKYENIINKFKKILFILRKSILNKKTTLIICKKKKVNFFKKKFRGKYIKVCKNFFNGFISNKVREYRGVENIISFGKVSDYVFNEINKRKIKGILLSMESSLKSKPDIHLLVNTNIKRSVNFISNQIVNIEKKNSYKFPFFKKKNMYYFCKKNSSKKIVIIVLQIKQDLFIHKKYFSLTIKKIMDSFFLIKKGNMYFIRNKMKKICQFYNEKIKIVGIKFINCRINYLNFYLHNNKKLSFCIYKERKDKEIVRKIIMNLISLEDRIGKNFFKEEFIFKPSKTIGKIIKNTSIIKTFFVR